MPITKPLFDLYQTGRTIVTWPNAYLLCLASRHAYYPRLRISAKQTRDTLIKWGLSNIVLISRGDTQCFLGSNNKVIFLVFRGTEPNRISDFVTDVKFKQIRSRAYSGKVHRGFMRAHQDVWPDILRGLEFDINANGDRPICIAGHSLGAALATLATYRIENAPNFVLDSLYTYGCPRAGDDEFADSFKGIRNRIFRFENNNDIVPKMPPKKTLKMNWKHVCLPDYFHHDGRYEKDPTKPDRYVDMVLGRLQAMTEPGVDGIHDHGLKYYAQNIKKQMRSSKTKNRMKAPWSNYW